MSPLQKMKPMNRKFNLIGNPKEREVGSGGGLAQGIRNAFSSVKEARESKQSAASAARLEAARVALQRERHEFQSARDAIQQAVNTPPDADDKDVIVAGAGRAIARMAGKDPRTARALAGMLRENAQLANEALVKSEAEMVKQRAIAQETRDGLKAKPFRLQAGFFGRLTAALLTGDPKSMGDTVVVDDEKVRIRNPRDARARQVFRLEKFHTGDLSIAPDPPRWADRIVNAIATLAPDNEKGDRFMDRIEGLVPFGHVAVFSIGRDEPLSRTPTWFPGRRAAKFQQIIDDTLEPPTGFSQFIPEPSERDLLQASARDLGIGGRSSGRRRLRLSLPKRRQPQSGANNGSDAHDESTARFRAILKGGEDGNK